MTRPAETRPAETLPAETLPAETLPAETRPADGHLNPAIRNLAAPPIPLVQGWARSYGGGRGPLIDLSQAVPGYPPHADMLTWLAEAAGAAKNSGYGAIEGEAVLREACASHLSELYGGQIEPGNLQITSGCNQAFVATMIVIASPGDEILLTNPCFFNHEAALKMLGIQPRFLDCTAADGFVPDPGRIAAAVTPLTRAVVLVTPNNPTGAVYPSATLQAIAQICRERGIWLVTDETYRDFIALGADGAAQRPHDLLADPQWGQTLIQLYSFSKAYCIPGHRVGAITARTEIIAQTVKVMDNLQICAPRHAQIALSRALPALAGWRKANASEIADRAAAFRAALAQAPGWEIAAIGAYFAYVRHPFADLSSLDVAARLARDGGVLCLPGEFFGTGQQRYLRLAFANADADIISGLAPRLNALSKA